MNIIEEPDCLDIWKDNGEFSINAGENKRMRDIRASRPQKVNLNNTSNPKREVLINKIRDRIRKNKK